MKVKVLMPRYVANLPEQLEEGVFYICEEFDATAHKCCCGCGEEVYNKLGPAKWQLTKEHDGTVSLHPSVGNWKYACRSHYWIANNRVIDAGAMSNRAIKAVQERDRCDRDRAVEHYNAQTRQTLWQRVGTAIVRAFKKLLR
jgi:hypothetical protein